MIFSIFVIFIVTSSCAADEVGRDLVWAVMGRSVALNCPAENDNCTWTSPNGQTLSKSRYHPTVKFLHGNCNLKITSVEEEHLGEWTCSTGTKVKNVFDVSLAQEPGSIHLETVSETFEVRCVVAKARPRPEFVWYMDDVLLEEGKTEDFEGKTLTCTKVTNLWKCLSGSRKEMSLNIALTGTYGLHFITNVFWDDRFEDSFSC